MSNSMKEPPPLLLNVRRLGSDRHVAVALTDFERRYGSEAATKAYMVAEIGGVAHFDHTPPHGPYASRTMEISQHLPRSAPEWNWHLWGLFATRRIGGMRWLRLSRLRVAVMIVRGD